MGGTSCTTGTTYTYDGDGRRVMKSSGTIYWYGMNSDALMETDLANNDLSAYIFMNGKRVGRQLPTNEVDFYFTDALGTSRYVYSLAGWNVSDYYPFGGERPISTGTPNHYKFTGKERDFESNLDNFGARYDSSQYGRFMSPDPGNYGADLTNPQSWNMYSYVLNNPLNLIDPDGLDCVYLNDDETAGSVRRGDCASDKDNGIFVNGAVDTTKGASLTGDRLTFNYTPDGSKTETIYSDEAPNPGLPASADQMPLALNGQQMNPQSGLGNSPPTDQQKLMAVKVSGMMAAHGMKCAGKAFVSNEIPFGDNFIGKGTMGSNARELAEKAATHPFTTSKVLNGIAMPNIGHGVVSAEKLPMVAKNLQRFEKVSPAINAYNFAQDMGACYGNPDE